MRSRHCSRRVFLSALAVSLFVFALAHVPISHAMPAHMAATEHKPLEATETHAHKDKQQEKVTAPAGKATVSEKEETDGATIKRKKRSLKAE